MHWVKLRDSGDPKDKIHNCQIFWYSRRNPKPSTSTAPSSMSSLSALTASSVVQLVGICWSDHQRSAQEQEDVGLHEEAAALLLDGSGLEDSADSFIEDSLHALLGQSRTLQELGSVDFHGQFEALQMLHGGLLLLSQTFNAGFVLSQVQLGCYHKDGDVGTVVVDFWVPLGLDVLEGSGGDDGEAREEDVRLMVGERTKMFEILLSSSVQEFKVNGFVVHHYIGRVVIKESGNVVTREGIGGVRNQQARLTDSSVTDNDTLHSLHDEKSSE